jgi:hypothetical protein
MKRVARVSQILRTQRFGLGAKFHGCHSDKPSTAIPLSNGAIDWDKDHHPFSLLHMSVCKFGLTSNSHAEATELDSTNRWRE